MSHNILNPTTSRVVYSDDARVIAGGERIYDITPDGTTDRAVARGDLILETAEDDQDAGQSGPDEDAPPAPGESDPEQAH